MTPGSNIQAEVLSIDDVGRIAGIGRTTIYRLVSSGALPARKIGRKTIVMRQDLDSYLASLPMMQSRCGLL